MNRLSIPNELRQHAQWVNWRDEKRTKIPYQPNGQIANKTNPDHFSRFESVVKAVSRFTGIGFCFTADDPFVGIDLDGCRDPESGKIESWGRGIIISVNSYCEVSPSMTGVKIIAIGSNPFESGKNVGLDFENKFGKRPGVEIYDRGAYFTITGMRLKKMDSIREIEPERIRKLIERLPKAKRSARARQSIGASERAARYVASMPPAISGSGGHNQTFSVACVLVLGFCLTPEKAFPIMETYNERCEPPWSEKELWHKLNSANEQSGQRGYLRDANPDDWSSNSSTYSVSQPKKRKSSAPPLRITSMRDAAVRYVDNLASDATLEKYSTGIAELDERLNGGLSLGNVVTIGARTGEGKTMLGLQITYALAAQGLVSLIVSEEMAEAKISKRVVQYASDIPLEEWIGSEPIILSEVNRHFDTRAGIYVAYHLKHVHTVIEAIRNAKVNFGAQVVLVDYLQRLDAPGGNEFQKVTNASSLLANITRELGVLTIALCQVGREVSQHTHRKTAGKSAKDFDVGDFIPTKSDLKQSGRIEEDSDVVIMGFWVQGSIPSHPYENDYLLRVEKNRDERTDKTPIFCVMDGQRMKIDTISSRASETLFQAFD